MTQPGDSGSQRPGNAVPSESAFRVLTRAAFNNIATDDDMDTPVGVLFRSVSELDFALQKRITITLDDITHEQFLALRIFEEEKLKYQERQMRGEQAEQRPKKWSRVG